MLTNKAVATDVNKIIKHKPETLENLNLAFRKNSFISLNELN